MRTLRQRGQPGIQRGGGKRGIFAGMLLIVQVLQRSRSKSGKTKQKKNGREESHEPKRTATAMPMSNLNEFYLLLRQGTLR